MLPEGFQVVAGSPTGVTVSNENDTVSVTALPGVLDRPGAQPRAVEVVGAGNVGAAVGSFVPSGSGALTFDKAPWTATDADGIALTGDV